MAYDAGKLKLPGSVSIIQINPSAGFSLTGTIGTARVAWNAGNSLPVVQCVRVQRAGNALTGLTVRLLKLSKRIQSDAACPASISRAGGRGRCGCAAPQPGGPAGDSARARGAARGSEAARAAADGRAA